MREAIELYQFTKRFLIALSPAESNSILHAEPGSRVRVNFNRDVAVVVGDSRTTASIYTGSVRAEVDYDTLEYSARTGKAIIYTGDKWVAGEVRSKSYYKLAPTHRGPPTVEIDGIHMHRILGTDPLEDAKNKIRAAKVSRGHTILDICTGLGYTSIASLMRGAARVYTIEVDENVLYLASLNPWSSSLSNGRITLIHGDATRIIHYFHEESFHRIIHDPPRLTSKTGDLYSLEFYKDLYRLLKPGGLLFHYTGEPGRKRGLNIPGRVSSRLKKAGFHVIEYNRQAQGIIATKPQKTYN